MSNLRRFGSGGLTTPPLILGGNVFGWTADTARSFAVLDAFVAGGGRMVDTADVYSAWAPGNEGGESESIIGDWLAKRGRRGDLLIATKVGWEGGLSAANIENRVSGSLKRLRVDCIDLLCTQGRSKHAARGNSGSVRTVGSDGEGPDFGRLKLLWTSPGEGDQGRRKTPSYRLLGAAKQLQPPPQARTGR